MLELLSDYNRDACALIITLTHYTKDLHPDLCNASALLPAVLTAVRATAVTSPIVTIPLVERITIGRIGRWLARHMIASSNLTALVRTGLAMILAAQASSPFAADNEDTAPKLEPPLTIAPLQPLAEHPRTSVNVVEQLRRNHYLSKPIDDALSSAMLDKYLNILDSSKSYFLASDIQASRRCAIVWMMH